MGVRIGSIWVREKDGNVTRTGTLECDTGINLPAGQRLSVSVVKNDKKVEGDQQPDFHLEAWVPRQKDGQ